jgi:ribosomal-protein-alanine N-acetyltransferase
MMTEAELIRVRAMASSDIEAVCWMAASLAQAPHWPRSVYESAIDSQGRVRRIALVAEAAGGRLAGYCVASLVPPQAELETIAVVAEHQRKGVARRILSLLFAKLKASMVTEVMLEVRASNLAARALYARAGFVESGRRLRYYADPEEDALLLTRHLG